MQPHSGPFLSFLAYHMGGFLRSVSSHRIWEPLQISFFSYYGGLLKLCLFFFHAIWGPLRSFLCILYWGPQITFFAYYMGPLRSLSSHTIWGPLSDQFRCLLYGAPLRSVSLHAIEGGGGDTPDFSFFTKYMGAPSDQFLRLLYGASQASFSAYYMGPLRSVFVHTFWGPLSARSFFSLTIWGLLRSVSSHTIWGPSIRSVSSLTICMGGPLRSVYSLTI